MGNCRKGSDKECMRNNARDEPPEIKGGLIRGGKTREKKEITGGDRRFEMPACDSGMFRGRGDGRNKNDGKCDR